MISKNTFIIRVMVDTERGTNSLMTIARPAPLPTVTRLGTIKKNTAVATMMVPTVMIRNSFIFCFLYDIIIY